MTPNESNASLVDLVRKRPERMTLGGCGIRLASDYVGGVLAAIGMDGITAYPNGPSLLKEAENRLVYRNDDMAYEPPMTSMPAIERYCKSVGVDVPPRTLMVFENIVTTSQEDRDGDVLCSEGAIIDPKMPLLWHHMLPSIVGKMLAVREQNDRHVRVASAVMESPLGQDVANLIEFGALRISHGFRPLEFSPRDRDKGLHDGKGSRQRGFRIASYECLEESVVSVPSNVGAEIIAWSRGKVHTPVVKSWCKHLYDQRDKVFPSGAVQKFSVPIELKIDVRPTFENGEVTGMHVIQPAGPEVIVPDFSIGERVPEEGDEFTESKSNTSTELSQQEVRDFIRSLTPGDLVAVQEKTEADVSQDSQAVYMGWNGRVEAVSPDYAEVAVVKTDGSPARIEASGRYRALVRQPEPKPEESALDMLRIEPQPKGTDGKSVKGGPGSGNFDHAGIPGQVGGSTPSGGGGSASESNPAASSSKPAGEAKPKEETKPKGGSKPPRGREKGKLNPEQLERMREHVAKQDLTPEQHEQAAKVMERSSKYSASAARANSRKGDEQNELEAAEMKVRSRVQAALAEAHREEAARKRGESKEYHSDESKAANGKPTPEAIQLGQDAAHQAANGHNPPNWAVDEELWERAKKAADKTYDEGDEAYWPVVVTIYQNMGGTIQGKSKTATLDAKGGAGSGNFGHAGIPGQVGGSASSGGGSSSSRIHEDTGLPLNPDGTVTLYHGTTAEGAAAIRRTGQLRSAGEPDVYLTTHPTATTGYGDGTVIAIRVDPDKLTLDDEFPDGRQDFRMSVGKPGGSVPVKVEDKPAKNSDKHKSVLSVPIRKKTATAIEEKAMDAKERAVCPECGEAVEVDDEECPECGAELTEKAASMETKEGPSEAARAAGTLLEVIDGVRSAIRVASKELGTAGQHVGDVRAYFTSGEKAAKPEKPEEGADEAPPELDHGAKLDEAVTSIGKAKGSLKEATAGCNQMKKRMGEKSFIASELVEWDSEKKAFFAKAGRVLSAENEGKLRAALDALRTILEKVEPPAPEGTFKPVPEPATPDTNVMPAKPPETVGNKPTPVDLYKPDGSLNLQAACQGIVRRMMDPVDAKDIAVLGKLASAIQEDLKNHERAKRQASLRKALHLS